MRIGVAREVKDGERRVAITPEGVRALVADGHASPPAASPARCATVPGWRPAS